MSGWIPEKTIPTAQRAVSRDEVSRRLENHFRTLSQNFSDGLSKLYYKCPENCFGGQKFWKQIFVRLSMDFESKIFEFGTKSLRDSHHFTFGVQWNFSWEYIRKENIIPLFFFRFWAKNLRNSIETFSAGLLKLPFRYREQKKFVWEIFFHIFCGFLKENFANV